MKRKILILMISFFIVHFLTFACLLLIPIEQIETTGLTEQQILNLKAKYQLDQNVWLQYINYWTKALKLDAGISYKDQTANGPKIINSLQISLILTTISYFFGTIIVRYYIKQQSIKNQLKMNQFDKLFITTPYIIIIPLISMLGSKIGNFPTFYDETLSSLIIPIIILTFYIFAQLNYYLKLSLKTKLDESHWFENKQRLGLTKEELFKSDLRPIIFLEEVNNLPRLFTAILVGSTILETVFAVPGLGQLLIVQGIKQNNQYLVLNIITIIMLINIGLQIINAIIINNRRANGQANF